MDLGKQKIQVDCPTCRRKHNATFNDVGKQKVIHCYCGTNIQLRDDKGSVKRSVNDINKAFKELEKTLKNFGK